MKIVYITYSVNNLSGVERTFISQLNYLAEQMGYDMTLLTYEQGAAPDAYRLSDKVRHIDFHLPLFRAYRYPLFIRPFIFAAYTFRLRRFITRQVALLSPDVVVCTSYAIREMRIVLSLPGVKHVVQTHCTYQELGGSKDMAPSDAWLKRLYCRWRFRRAVHFMKRFDRIVTLTQGDAANWHVPNVSVISNPLIPLTATAEPPAERQKKVVAVGRLVRVKGFDLLIEAWLQVADKHPDWLLEITGDGVERQNLELRAAGHDSIVISPSTHDVAHIYQTGSIFVMSSRYEAFGLVLLEAMSFGLPCVAYSCSYGPSEIITHGENGYLVPTGDVEALAERIDFLISRADERQRIGANARRAVYRFDLDCIMAQWKQLYEEL